MQRSGFPGLFFYFSCFHHCLLAIIKLQGEHEKVRGVKVGDGSMAIDIKPMHSYWLALLSVCCLIVFVFVLPQFFISYFQRSSESVDSFDTFKLGLENISQDFLRALTQRNNFSYTVALVTNHTGHDQVGNRNVDILIQKGLNIKKIFVPYDDLDAGSHKSTGQKHIDSVTRIPIFNLLGRQINVEDFKKIDVIFFDLQDVGIRYSGSLGILLNVMEVAGRLGKTVVVLDRPNLLGDAIEGAFEPTNLQQSLLSVSVPIRYGMTIGELAQYCNKYLLKTAAKLFVVPMDHYNRHLYPYKAPTGKLSPNIHSIESCHGYSFLGLLGEVAPFDIGIGTDKAFQCILLPHHIAFSKKQWFNLKEQLKVLGIDSGFYRYYSYRKKEFCRGLRVCIRDIGTFSLFKALVATLEFFQNEGVALKFSDQFSKIPGMYKVKELVKGTRRREDFEAELKYELEQFFVMASSSFIYKPYPKVVLV